MPPITDLADGGLLEGVEIYKAGKQVESAMREAGWKARVLAIRALRSKVSVKEKVKLEIC